MLLAAGAAMDQARPDGTTPLYIACQKSHLELVSMLLAASVPVDQLRPGSATLLHIACQNGHLAVATVLCWLPVLQISNVVVLRHFTPLAASVGSG